MNRLNAAAIVAVVLLAAGCSSSVDNPPDVTATDPTSGNLNPAGGSNNPMQAASTAALFQLAQGIFPFPNDFYFGGSTDGTLNLPANALVPNQAGLNALDGYSLTAPWRVLFASPINAATLNASTVRVIEVTLSATNVPTPVRPLVYGTDFTAALAADAGVGNTIVEIRPLRPLTRSGTGATQANPLGNTYAYFVYLTNGIATAAGAQTTADADYAAFRAASAATPACGAVPTSATQACQLVGAHLAVGNAFGITPASVVVSFSFRTQDTRATMDAVAATIFASPAAAIAVAPTAIPGTAINTAFTAFNIRSGTVTVPYYSPIATGPQDASILSRFWTAAAAPPPPLADAANERNLTRFNRVPAKIADKAIPMIVTVPVTAKPTAGWPIVIFQHGLGGDRSQAIAIAQTFAGAGWAVASVDATLHGITSTTSPFYQAANEQHFNLDLVNNTTGATGPDGAIDASGNQFINLTNPRASRDSVRQGITNLLALTRALPNLNLDGDTATVDIDGSRIAYVGISLGGILGTGYTAVLPNPTTLVRTSVLSVPGGGVAALLRDSPTFAPRINAGLAVQGLQPGTTLYANFFRDVQTIIDAGDPVNYIASAVAQRNVYVSQVIGGSGTPPSLPDQVIPNSATQRLLDAAGPVALPRVLPGAQRVGSGHVNFVAGEHGSLLTPGTPSTATGLAVLTEMQTQAAVFTATGGNISIVNAAVVQP